MESSNKITCKMQNNSLKIAVDGLKSVENRASAHAILIGIASVLKAYNCEASKILRRRVSDCRVQIPDIGTLSEGDKVKIKMLISEIEAFMKETEKAS